MSINVRSFSEMVKRDVFTSKGVYCGKVSNMELDMEKFRIKSIVVDAVRGSFLSSMVGDKKGVVIPFQMVNSIGDIVIIKHISSSSIEEEAMESPESSEESQPTMPISF